MWRRGSTIQRVVVYRGGMLGVYGGRFGLTTGSVWMRLQVHVKVPCRIGLADKAGKKSAGALSQAAANLRNRINLEALLGYLGAQAS